MKKLLIALLILFSVSASAWFSDCYYRQLINATTAQAVTNHTLRIHMNGTDMGENFNWAVDNETMTFTNITDSELDCWHEMFNDTQENFTVWCRQDTIEGNTLLYLYYNCSSVDNNNIENVFGDNLAAFYTFDQAGTTATDFGGSTANDATISDAAAIQTTEAFYGSALDSTSDEYAQASDDNELDITGDITIIGWIYWNDYSGGGTQEGAPVFKAQESGSWDANYAINWGETGHAHSSEPTFLWDQSGAKDHWGDTALPYQRWVLFATTHDDTGNVVDFYYNGSLVTDDVAAAEAKGADAQPLTIGCGWHSGAVNYCWEGYIDNVMIYSEALSADDIASLYISEPPTYEFNTEEVFSYSYVLTGPTTTLEGDLETYSFNLTYNTSWHTAPTAVTLTLNNTVHTPTTTVSGEGWKYYTIDVYSPQVLEDANNTTVNYRWNFTLNDTVYQTTLEVLFVEKFLIKNCSNGDTGESLRFYILEELDDSQMINSTFEAEFTVTSGNLSNDYNFDLNNRGNYSFCIEPNDSEFMVTFAEILYSNESYDDRRYYLTNLSINSTLQEFNLYLLDSTTSAQVDIKVYEEDYSTAGGVIVKALKEYLGGGTSYLVSAMITDFQGETTMYLEPDKEYEFLIETASGEILGNFENILIAGTPPIERIFILNASHVTGWETFGRITHNCANETNILTCTYSDTSGAVVTVGLNVYLYGRLGMYENCSETVSSSSGALECNLGNSTGRKYMYELYAITSSGVYELLETDLIYSGSGPTTNVLSGDLVPWIGVLIMSIGGAVGAYSLTAGIVGVFLGLTVISISTLFTLETFLLGVIGITGGIVLFLIGR